MKEILIVTIACVLFFIGSCNNKSESLPAFYRDYNFKNEKGIGKISFSEKSELVQTKESFIKMIYRENKIDSIYFMDSVHSQGIGIEKKANDSVAVYHLCWPFSLYGLQHQYIVYKPSCIDDYFFPTPVVSADQKIECRFIHTAINTSISQMCSISQKDTSDFVNSLLAGKVFSFVRVNQRKEMPGINNDTLTLVKYINFSFSISIGSAY